MNEDTELQVYGDMEFVTNRSSLFYVQAATRVYCAALSLDQYGDLLHQDVLFLNYLLENAERKLSRIALLDVISESLADRVLYYLENISRDHMIHSVNGAVTALRCSRRQLQRVLHDLCLEGKIVKVKKGVYRLCV